MYHFFSLTSAVLFSNISAPSQAIPEESNETLPQFLERTTNLLDHLMLNYRSELPAVYTRALDRYTVDKELKQEFKVVLMYGKLLNINEPEQSATMLIEAYLYWTDFRLTWNPKDFYGIKALLINQQKLWIPDVMPIDLINYRSNIDLERQNCLVAHNGSIVYFTSAVITFNCQIKSWAFPFDTQECRIKMASRNFLTREVDLISGIFERFTKEEMSNGEWQALEVRTEPGPNIFDMYGWEYPVVSLVFRVKRNSTYYVNAMILPSFMLTVLVMFGIFWSPINEGNYMERLSLGFAAKLALLMILEITADHLPRSQEVPILSFYVLASLFLMTTAIGAALFMAKFVKTSAVAVRQREEVKLATFDLKANWCPAKKPFLRTLSCNSHTSCLIFFCSAAILNLIFLIGRGHYQL